MVPVLKAKGNVVEHPAPDRVNAGVAVEPRIRRAVDDPAEVWVPAGGRLKVKDGNVTKTNRRKRIRRCKNARF
jgi:hypothetical protein